MMPHRLAVVAEHTLEGGSTHTWVWRYMWVWCSLVLVALWCTTGLCCLCSSVLCVCSCGAVFAVVESDLQPST